MHRDAHRGRPRGPRLSRFGPLRVLAAALLLGTPGVVAGCGDNTAATGSATAPPRAVGSGTTTVGATPAGPGYDPCALLPSGDAQAALGQPVDPPSAGTAQDPACVYAVHSTASPPDLSSVGLHLVDATQFEGTRAGAAAAGGHVEAATGLGDEAFVEVTAPPASQVFLFVRRGGVRFYVSVVRQGAPAADLAAAERAVAARVLSRL